jgi:hypothetical protein
VTPTPTLVVPTFTPTPGTSGGGGESGGGQPGNPGPPYCGVETPKAPVLLSVERVSPDQAELIWYPVDTATHYSISYGLSSGNYIYGVDNTGKVTQFTVGSLAAGQDYCFAVRAVNECAPGPLSNEICTSSRGTGGMVLGASVLGATGETMDNLFLILFSLGCFSFSWGFKKFSFLK